MKRTLLAVALAGSVGLSGCISHNPNASHTTEGAVSGGLIGAGLGALATPHHAGRGALIGAVLGVVTGAIIGSNADAREAYFRHHLRHHAIYIERHGDRVVLIMPSRELFADGSADLRPRAEGTLQDVANNVRHYGDTRVKVYGYSADGNGQLSQAQAEAVAGVLAENGVDRARISAQGRGDAQPRGNGPDDPRNSRVEVVVEPSNG